MIHSENELGKNRFFLVEESLSKNITFRSKHCIQMEMKFSGFHSAKADHFSFPVILTWSPPFLFPNHALNDMYLCWSHRISSQTVTSLQVFPVPNATGQLLNAGHAFRNWPILPLSCNSEAGNPDHTTKVRSCRTSALQLGREARSEAVSLWSDALNPEMQHPQPFCLLSTLSSTAEEWLLNPCCLLSSETIFGI